MKTEEIKEVPITLPPATPVPIMVELTEEDKNKAAPYVNNEHCIIATALRRMGRSKVHINSCYGVVDGQYYVFDGGDSDDLWDQGEKCYKPDVVGKQIIMYPDEMPAIF